MTLPPSRSSSPAPGETPETDFRAAMQPRTAAYQLSLLGDEPKPGLAWRPEFWVITINGESLGVLDDDARRQMTLMTQESLAAVRS